MEDPIDCGLRELFEETGITGERKSSKIIYSEVRDDHTFYIIFVEIPSLKGLEKVGDEGEEVRVFSEEEVLRMKLLYSHEEVVKSSIIALKDERRMEVQRT
jgi:8-oxo-dGTP pyrophosphatase MutT (NUDIX family)